MIKCPDCGRTFRTPMGLAVHQGKGGCAKQILTKCDQCGKTYEVDPQHRCRFPQLNHHFCSLKCSREWSEHPITAVCEECGKTYNLDSKHRSRAAKQKHRFCSRECFHSWMRREKESDTKVTLTCAWCGKEFKVFPSRAKGGQQFCSAECTNQWKKEALTGANGPGWKGGPKTVVCKNCGKEFLNVKYRSNVEFCSRACADEWKVGENAPAWKGGVPIMTCLHCGKEFQDKQYGASRFCSRSCFFLYHGRTRNEELIAAFLRAEEIPFEEQYAVPGSNYTVDFYLRPYLIIETDGACWHDEAKDEARDSWLEAHGYQVMRLDYYDVLNTDDWQTLILDAISVGVL